jgi:hypothetical protein
MLSHSVPSGARTRAISANTARMVAMYAAGVSLQAVLAGLAVVSKTSL